jgi:hypothetical protein
LVPIATFDTVSSRHRADCQPSLADAPRPVDGLIMNLVTAGTVGWVSLLLRVPSPTFKAELTFPGFADTLPEATLVAGKDVRVPAPHPVAGSLGAGVAQVG